MTKVFLPAALLFVVIACETAPPTARAPEERDPFGGGAAPQPVAPGWRPSFQTLPEACLGTDPICRVLPSTLTGNHVITFNEFTGTQDPGLNFDGVVDLDGAAFAERLGGQSASSPEGSDFDVLSGAPTAPLSAQVGAPNQNVNIVFDNPSNAQVIDGLGPTGFPNPNAIGEGALAVVFDADQFELGFEIVGANAGTATVSFFKRDGSLIETEVLSLETLAGAQPFAFRRAASTRDIAGISIHNDDNGGIGYDNFRIHVTSGSGSTSQRVPAGQAATVTVQENGRVVAGIDVPANTFAQDVTVTVRFVELGTNEECNTTLDGHGRCLQITAKNADGSDATYLQNTIVALCVAGGKAGRDLFEFEPRSGRPRALQETDETFTNCTGFIGSAPSSWLEQFANDVRRWLLPRPLMAFNLGVGHLKPPGRSFFTYGPRLPISNAGLAVNAQNSGQDVFGVSGVFNQPVLTPPTVTVGFGQKFEKTITFNLSQLRSGWWVYTAPRGPDRILALAIRQIDGSFGVAGSANTEGLGPGTLTFRAFSLKIGTNTKGAGLECSARGRCTVHPDHPH